MAAPDQQQQASPEGAEIAKLFQNVGQGLTLVAQYVSQAAPQATGMANQLLEGYQQLVQQVAQTRQGGGQAEGQAQPLPQEAGGAEARQAF